MTDQTLGINEQFCPSCGAIANENAPHCPDCGQPINPQQTVTESNNDVEIGYETEHEKRERQINAAKQAVPLLKSGVLWIIGIFLILGGIGFFVPPESYPLAGAVAVIFGVVFLPPVHRLVGKDADPLTFGSRRTVREKTVTDPKTPCASCAGSIDRGVKRTRVKQYLAFGGEISSENNGELVYCQGCARSAETTKTEQSVSSSEHTELSVDNEINNKHAASTAIAAEETGTEDANK